MFEFAVVGVSDVLAFGVDCGVGCGLYWVWACGLLPAILWLISNGSKCVGLVAGCCFPLCCELGVNLFD